MSAREARLAIAASTEDRPAADAAPRTVDRLAGTALDALLGRVRLRTVSLLLFLACVAVYASNGKTLNMGDSVPARLIPIAIVLDGTPMLDRFSDAIATSSRLPYFVRQTPYGLASWYPIATGLLATPIVAPAIWWIEWRSAPDAASWLAISRGLEKVAAMFLMALAVVVFHALCRALAIRPVLALLVTLTFGFGSEAFSTSSQALWQHGSGCLVIVAALWCLVRARVRPRAVLLASFSALAALAIAIRPNNLLIMGPFALVAFWQHPRRWLALLAPAALGGMLLAAYNLVLFGTLTGGYGTVAASFGSDLSLALAGLLMSPARGLFVYFPVSILLLLLLALEPRDFASAFAGACLAGIVATILLTAAWPNWWGGYSYGPRLLSETQPLILLLLALGITACARPERRRVFTLALAALLPVQIAIQAIGTYGPPDRPPAAVMWNASPVSIDVAPERNWDLADNPIARGLRGYD